MNNSKIPPNQNASDDDNSWDCLFDVEGFLVPWKRVLQKWDESAGISVMDTTLESKLREAAEKVYDAAFNHPEEIPSEEIVLSAEWLLEMLAPGGGDDPEAYALIPESFWSKLAGRAIILIMKACRKEVFLPMKEAAIILGVDETRLYHLAMTRRIPCYIDMQERNFRMRRRFRVDQLKEKYPIIYKPLPGKKDEVDC